MLRRRTVEILFRNLAAAWTGVFLLKGKSPRELFPHRDLSRRTSYPVRRRHRCRRKSQSADTRVLNRLKSAQQGIEAGPEALVAVG